MEMSHDRFLVIDCNTLDPVTTAWQPRSIFDIFKDGFALVDAETEEREEVNRIEEWSCCRIACGEKLPTEICDYKAVLISGSHYCVRDNVEWFDELAQFIRKASKIGSPNVFAGCFGCQLVAYTLGGIVDKNTGGLFVLKAENIAVNDQGAAVLGISSEKPMNIIVSHGDSVLQLPNGAKILASSPSCTNELYVCGHRDNILCCQSHPEFDYDYCMRDRIWKAVVEKKDRLNEEQKLESITSFENYNGRDALVMLNAVKKFIRR